MEKIVVANFGQETTTPGLIVSNVNFNNLRKNSALFSSNFFIIRDVGSILALGLPITRVLRWPSIRPGIKNSGSGTRVTRVPEIAS